MLRVLYYTRPELCLEIRIEEETITGISFCEEPLNEVVEGSFEHEIVRQLDAWFAGDSQEFDLAFFATGTAFQLQVWEETMRIPYGQTLSYRDIAEQIGNPNAVRAVGAALRANPVPILIPCHRVIGSDGKLSGYAGSIPVKRFLLGLEHKHQERG
jgi:methylated-DNA-[protein]-cysteine S-methyltransferase